MEMWQPDYWAASRRGPLSELRSLARDTMRRRPRLIVIGRVENRYGMGTGASGFIPTSEFVSRFGLFTKHPPPMFLAHFVGDAGP